MLRCMRAALLSLLPWLVACGSVGGADPDAGPDADADAPPGCQPTVLLAGGSDVVAQGWSIVMQQPATLGNGADYVSLSTTTTTGSRTSGQLLLSRAGVLELGKPFALQMVMMVESVSRHNQLDSAAAILGSFTPPFGNSVDRAQMIYLDSGAVGWADDTQTYAFAVAGSGYHTYELSVDAAGAARLTIDGAAALMRAGFMFNGTIALGDQTNDPNVDGVLRIRSVTKLCLPGA